MTLARHPANPDRPYMPWTKKVKMQLQELQAIPHPDIRTRRDIDILKAKLSAMAANLGKGRQYPRQCSGSTCTRVVADPRFKQCQKCRDRKAEYMRNNRRSRWATNRRPKVESE